MLKTELSEKIAIQGKLNKEETEDTILDLLILAYVFGNADANESLGTDIGVDTDQLYDSLYREFEGETYVERLSKHIDANDIDGITRVMETEAHRDYNEGAYNTATKGGAKYKRWSAVMDDRTRETHWYLENVRIPIDQDFYTIAGNHAPYPGGFGVPEEDCNCRCIAVYE